MRTFILLCCSLFPTFTLLAQGPANDDCATALPITCGQTISGTTVGAFPDEAFNCGTSITAPGVWYMLPGANAAITVSTCSNNSYDTKINVYQGNCGTITCVGGNDDSAGCGLGSSVSFAGNGGATYYILVQGYNNATGTFELSIDCVVLDNDDCNGAQAIACGSSLAGTTIGAFPDEAFDCGTSITAPGVWYTASGLVGQAVVSTCSGSSYDTKINVYRGSCGVIECVGGNDDTPGQGLCSTFAWNADPDETYQILVQGFDNATGSFTLTLACSNCPAPANATVVPLDTTATVDWDSWNPGALYFVEFGPQGFTPGTGTVLAGVVGADGPPLSIGGLQVDSDYAIYIQEQCGTEQSAIVGPVSFTTLPSLIAANATCANATALDCGAAVAGNTTFGLLSAGPTCGSANITTKGLWYTLTGNGDVISLSTCGQTNFDSKISVFNGNCGALECVAGNDDAPGCGGNSSLLSFPSTAGTAYLVLVHGYNQAQGQFTISVSCAPSCSPVAANDDCTGATILSVSPPGGCEAVTGSNACAFAPALPNPACVPFAPIVDVWYMFNSGNAPELTLLLEATTAGTLNAALYAACGSQQYITCWTGVEDAILLSGLEPEADHFLRVWNSGGGMAGEFTVCVEGDLGTALGSRASAPTISLRPVPTNDLLLVDGLSAPTELQVIDLAGRSVLTARATSAGTHHLHVAALAPGSYLLRDASNGRLLGRFVRE